MGREESECFIETYSYHLKPGFWMGRQHPSQLLRKSLKIATRLEPWRTLLRRTKKILLMINRVLTVFHKVVMNLVCLQGLEPEAKVHLQFWLAPNLFPNVVSTQLPPCCQSRGEVQQQYQEGMLVVCWGGLPPYGRTTFSGELMIPSFVSM